MKKGKTHHKAANNEAKPVVEEAAEEATKPVVETETAEPVAEEPKEETAEVTQEAPAEEVTESAAEEPKEETAEATEEAPAEEAAEKPEEEPAEEAGAEVAVEDPYEGLSADELKEQLVAAVAEAADMKRRLYSTAAEYDNYRKRTANTRVRAYADGRADVVSKLFPIADNLARALQSCAEEKTAQGIQMVVKAFEKVLEEEHITEINPLGEPFDAEKCEAIMAVEPVEGEESGIVKDVYLKGYEQNGKILRFAQVVVTK